MGNVKDLKEYFNELKASQTLHEPDGELGWVCTGAQYRQKGYTHYLLRGIFDDLTTRQKTAWMWIDKDKYKTASIYMSEGCEFIRNKHDTNGIQVETPNYYYMKYRSNKLLPDKNVLLRHNNTNIYTVAVANQNSNGHPDACGLYAQLNIMMMVEACKNPVILDSISDQHLIQELINNWMKQVVTLNLVMNAENQMTIVQGSAKDHNYSKNLFIKDTLANYQKGETYVYVNWVSGNDFKPIYMNKSITSITNDSWKKNAIVVEQTGIINQQDKQDESTKVKSAQATVTEFSNNINRYKNRLIYLETYYGLNLDFLINSTIGFYNINSGIDYNDDKSLLRMFEMINIKNNMKDFIIERSLRILKNFYESDSYVFALQIGAVNAPRPGHWISCVLNKLNKGTKIYFMDSIRQPIAHYRNLDQFLQKLSGFSTFGALLNEILKQIETSFKNMYKNIVNESIVTFNTNKPENERITRISNIIVNAMNVLMNILVPLMSSQQWIYASDLHSFTERLQKHSYENNYQTDILKSKSFKDNQSLYDMIQTIIDNNMIAHNITKDAILEMSTKPKQSGGSQLKEELSEVDQIKNIKRLFLR